MNLKKFYPFENYTLTTKLSGEEVLKRIEQNIVPKQKFSSRLFGRNTPKPYEGVISENAFTISRIIDYRNSFLPVITGNISSYPGQTQVNIKMRPFRFVLFFMGFWIGSLGLVCVGILLYGSFHLKQLSANGFSPVSLIPFFMFTAGYLMLTLSFKYESKKSKSFLAALLEEQKNY